MSESPETYVGYRQAEGFASPERVAKSSPQELQPPARTFIESMGIERIVERRS